MILILHINDKVIGRGEEVGAGGPKRFNGFVPFGRHRDFKLTNSGHHHRFGFTAQPPARLAARLDIRGDLSGSDLSDPAAWRGQIYGDIPYADLAGWQAWIDYPIELPQGRGAAPNLRSPRLCKK